MKTVATIHFNTPEMTEAAILSWYRHCGDDWKVVVFDNSDSRPFTKKMKGVKRIDNTKGQVVDFDAELDKYPDKCWDLAHKSNYGSMKHMMSVQKLWELIPDGFILMESDVLIRKDVSFLWDENYAACGKAQWFKGRRREKDRLIPFLCYMNVPKLVSNGAKYYDPERCWALMPGGKGNPNNWYDTGASLLEDIQKTKPQLVARLYPDLDTYYIHYHGGSWRQSDIENQKRWLEQYSEFWKPINQNAKIFIASHTDFKQVVSNKVYEILCTPPAVLKKEKVHNGFYSELYQMKKVSERKKLPKVIGWCHYRRYFGWMNNVPDLERLVEKHGAIVLKPFDLRMSMRDQFATWGNVEDLDICTQIINEKYPDFAPAWNNSLNSHYMHLATMSVMKTEDWKEMLAVMWDVANEYLKRIGGDIDKRVTDNPKAYHLDEGLDLTHERRVGGQFGERINSAWIDWKFPKALQVPLRVTQDKVIPE